MLKKLTSKENHDLCVDFCDFTYKVKKRTVNDKIMQRREKMFMGEDIFFRNKRKRAIQVFWKV